MQAIVAVDENWGIGREGQLLFHLKTDLAHFRALTLGHTVIMGRKTLLSLPGGRPLPKRRNIVLSRDPAFVPQDTEVARSAEDAVQMAEEDAFCIGGGSVYRQLLPWCDRVYVTRVFASAAADTFFPDLDSDPRWTVTERGAVAEENGFRFQYVTYSKV